jgi:hypothetical protein
MYLLEHVKEGFQKVSMLVFLVHIFRLVQWL